MTHDVFISFSFQDQECAEEIVNILSSRYGISCWICTRDIGGGGAFKKIIVDAIKASKIVVFIQSENSMQSKEVPKEITIALDCDKTIIPFKLDQSRLQGALEYDLCGVEYIDATKPSFEDRVGDLAQSIRRILLTEQSITDTLSHNIISLQSSKITCSEIFYGRDKIIEEIDESFKNRNVIFLRGMGGIGKSEIAKHYAKKYREKYSTVVFGRYEDNLATLIANDNVFTLNGVSRKVKEDGSLQNDFEYATEKINIIKSVCDERTLIILDNFDVNSDPLLDLLTNDINYRIIVTSRCEPERGKYFVIPISELENDILRDMVIDFANPETTLIERDDPAFDELFALTNRHTLTLELIAKYMEEKCIDDVSEMVDILKTQKLSALSDSDEVDRYSHIRNLFHMTSLSDNEKYFLRCLALMPPSGVDQRQFRSWIGNAFSSRARLAGLSLIRIDGVTKTVSLHPIVRQVILSDLKPEYSNCKEFLQTFGASICDGNSWNWTYDEKKFVDNCADEILSFVSEITVDTYELYYEIGVLKCLVQDWSSGSEYHQALYSFACKTFGPDSFKSGIEAFRTGWFCKKYGRIDDSIRWFEELSYPSLKKNSDIVYKEYTLCCTNLGTIYMMKYARDGLESDLQTAESYLNESNDSTYKIYIKAKTDGDSFLEKLMHQRIAGVRMEQAELAMLRREYSQARVYLEEAEQILTGYPNNDANIVYLMSKFSSLYLRKGEYSEAIDILEKNNELCLSVFSGTNDYSLNISTMLAECYEKVNDKNKALSYWENALEIAKDTFVSDHPTIEYIKKHLPL